MKKLRTWTMVISVVFFMVLLVGCGDSEVPGSDSLDLSKIEKITIHFETNSSSTMQTIIVDQAFLSSIDIDALTQVTLEDINDLMPVKEGYTFDHWYFDAELTETIDIDSPILTEYIDMLSTDNIELEITIYAGWTPVIVDIYTITYHLNGGINANDNIETYQSSDETFNLLVPTKEGYDFMGWYLDADFSTSMLTAITQGTTGDIELWASWTEHSVLTFEFEDDAYTVTDCPKDYSGIIHIPTMYNGYPVTKIGDYAFESCEDITEVVLSDDIVEIGIGAFSKCEKLETINLDSNIEIIGQSAFEECYALTAITIGDLVTEIRDFAFNRCTHLSTVTLGESVQILGRQAFAYTALTSITLNDVIETIGNFAFFDCTKLNQIVIPNTITYIGEFAFTNCFELTIYFESSGITGDWDDNWNSSNCPVVWNYQSIGEDVYTITYYLDGGINHPSNLNEVISSASFILEMPTKEGYLFVGWYSDSNYTQLVTEINSGTTENITLYAKWEEEASSNLLFTEYDTYVAVSGYSEITSVIDVPESYHGKPVTTIAEKAFYNMNGITQVILPETITIIEDEAFSYCRDLESINLPDSITTIGEEAFAACLLTTVEIPASLESCGQNVFYNNGELTSVVLPEGLTVIFEYMFNDCDELVSINIPSSVKEVKAYAFSSCIKLADVDLSHVSVIGRGAFVNCQSLTSVVLSDQLTIIDSYAFAYTHQLSSVQFPQHLQIIGESAFSGCSSLTELEFPQTLEMIGEGAFWGCKLATLELPSSLKVIGEEAFRYNDFTVLYLPIGLEKIEKLAFRNCDQLISIYLPSTIDVIEERVFRETGYQATIYINSESAPEQWHEAWRDYFTGSVEYQASFDDTIIHYELDGGTNSDLNPSHIVTCDSAVLSDPVYEGYNFLGWYLDSEWTLPIDVITYRGLDAMTIFARWEAQSENPYDINYVLDGGSNVLEAPYHFDGSSDVMLYSPTKVGYRFEGWFTEDTFEHEVTDIAVGIASNVTLYAKWEEDYLIYEEFDDYVAVVGLRQPLTHVVIPATYNGKPVTTIAENAFEYQLLIENITLPDTLTTIGNYSLKCENLRSIDLPEGLLSIGDSVYSGAYDLKEIVIPSTVTHLGTGVFSYCSSLTSVIFNNDMTTIPDYSFHQCFSLTTFIVPEGVTSIGEWAFRKCDALTTVTLPDSLLTIDREAFNETNSLTNLILPEGLETIGYAAFAKSGLTNLIIPNTVIEVGNEAWYYCSSLETLTIGSQVQSIFVPRDFKGLVSLESITVDENNAIYYDLDGVLYMNHEGVVLLKYPQHKVSSSLIIPEGVTWIANSAVAKADISEVYIPDSVLGLDNYAFLDCINLEEVYLSDQVASLGYGAFGNCDNLTIRTGFESSPSGWSDNWGEVTITIIWNVER